MPLGFMFHYCFFVERRLLFAAYLRGSATPKAQPSAATKARTKTNKADYPHQCVSDPWFGFFRDNSSFVVVVRLFSHGIVLVRLQSCL
jgi:hypothetical protein